MRKWQIFFWPVSIKNTSACRLPGISPQARRHQGIQPLSSIAMLDKEMTPCQSRDGAEIFSKAVASQQCNPEDGTVIPHYPKRLESGTIIALWRSVRTDFNKFPEKKLQLIWWTYILTQKKEQFCIHFQIFVRNMSVNVFILHKITPVPGSQICVGSCHCCTSLSKYLNTQIQCRHDRSLNQRFTLLCFDVWIKRLVQQR